MIRTNKLMTMIGQARSSYTQGVSNLSDDKWNLGRSENFDSGNASYAFSDGLCDIIRSGVHRWFRFVDSWQHRFGARKGADVSGLFDSLDDLVFLAPDDFSFYCHDRTRHKTSRNFYYRYQIHWAGTVFVGQIFGYGVVELDLSFGYWFMYLRNSEAFGGDRAAVQL